ncbi:response regulator transcription factor [Paenibacillus ihuae]|uniref:response regulator transcription factor n=1 Tax=Paenibacillus ihuae TaxID=1232431 RepID=UPI0006D53491|nr:response regulator [Paenibacillus ihuae]
MYKLLIADDEQEIRHGLSSYFPWHEIGYEVVQHVENGQKALEYITGHPVDVLLCDVTMPVMTGIELAERLHLEKSPVQVVFLSAHRNFEYAQQALQFGVRNYILKPTKYKSIFDTFTALKESLDSAKASLLQASSPGDCPPDLIAGHEDPVIRKIAAYLHEHFKEASLEGASQIVHMNPTYISKYFKQKTDTNFSDYLNTVRMQKAAELLSSHQFKTYEISDAVGYNNAKNFTRSFKKFYGKSPREYIQS